MTELSEIISVRGFQAEIVENMIHIQKKEQLIIIPAEEIASTSFVPPLILSGKFSITKKDGEQITIPVKRSVFEKAYEIKNNIDELAKIHAFEPNKFRTPIHYTVSFDNIVIVLIVLPLSAIEIFVGMGIAFWIRGIGTFIGLLLILMGFFMSFVTIRISLNAIEGTCPICDKKIKTNKTAKFLYCTRCKEKVLVENDYLEVR